MADTKPYEIQGAGGKRYVYKPPEKLAKVVLAFCWIVVACYIGRIATAVLVAATRTGGVDDPIVSVADGVVSLISVVFMLCSGFLSLKWIYRANANAHAMASGQVNSPPWSVGWFFVPFANLYKPYQAMRETWQVSARPEAWRSARAPGLLGWWWGVWIISNILDNVVFRLQMAGDAANGPGLDAVSVVSDVLDLTGLLLFMQVVRGLTALQVASRRGGTFD